jgi:hypothetical protein
MDAGYPDRFMALFERRGEAATVVDGVIYRLYSNMVVPFGPIAADYSISARDAARALRTLGGTVLRTTTGFRPGSEADEDDWYAVICRRFTPIEEVASSNARSKLRRAMRNCEVRRISCEDVATAGYEVYRRAFDRYRGAETPVSEPLFAAHNRAGEGFDDVLQHWGVLCDGTLAGYSTTYVFGDTEASYSSLKFDPEHLRRYTSYALFHAMNEHYLGGGRVAYVNDGFRSLKHETELQAFLERTFGFEKATVGLDAFYRQPYRALVRATFPLRSVIGRIDERVRALYELERVVRAARMQA